MLLIEEKRVLHLHCKKKPYFVNQNKIPLIFPKDASIFFVRLCFFVVLSDNFKMEGATLV